MSYHKAPGSLRWCEVRPGETGQRIQVLGPLASKALDGELFVTGLPEMWREVQPGVYVAPMGTPAPGDARQRIEDELERGGEPFTPLGIGYERGLRRALELLEQAERA